MIIVKLMGGLGNQMFQYAVGRRLAHQHGTELKLDLSFLQNNTEVITVRKFELHHLNIAASIATADEVSEYLLARKSRLQRLLAAAGMRPRRTFLAERHFHFDPAIMTAPDDCYLEGYWQSERYFKDIEGPLREEFQVGAAPDRWNLDMAEQIGKVDSVSVHVRRGDYVAHQAINAYHGTCSLQYYRNAISTMLDRVPEARFFVFSDDLGWVKENLELPGQTQYMDHNGPEHGCHDLRLMSLCLHNIVANSSFSWWGAWLGTAPGKIVIAPDKWFNTPDLDTRDLLPDSWLKVPV